MTSWRSVMACWIGSVFLLGALTFGAVACGSDDGDGGDQPATTTSQVEDEADELEKEADELEDELEQEADELEEEIRNP